MPAPRNRPEEDLQRTIAAFLPHALPADAVWWANTAQRGTRKRFEMGVLKAMGQQDGLPDLMIFWRRGLYCIELKSPKGVLSVAQVKMIARLKDAGAEVVVCRSPEAVLKWLREWGIPLKARLAA